MKKYTKKRIILLSAFFFALAALTVLSYFQVGEVCAQTMWDLQKDKMQGVAPLFGSSADNPRDVRAITVNIIKVFLSFIGIILIIMIILAGVKWMTAAGNQDRVSQARQQIQNAAIGVIIILAAYAITSWLADCVFDVSTSSPTVWMCH